MREALLAAGAPVVSPAAKPLQVAASAKDESKQRLEGHAHQIKDIAQDIRKMSDA